MSVVSHLSLAALGLANRSNLTPMRPSERAKHQTLWVYRFNQRGGWWHMVGVKRERLAGSTIAGKQWVGLGC